MLISISPLPLLSSFSRVTLVYSRSSKPRILRFVHSVTEKKHVDDISIPSTQRQADNSSAEFPSSGRAKINTASAADTLPAAPQPISESEPAQSPDKYEEHLDSISTEDFSYGYENCKFKRDDLFTEQSSSSPEENRYQWDDSDIPESEKRVLWTIFAAGTVWSLLGLRTHDSTKG